MENVLLYFSIKYKGDWDKIYHALDTKEKITHKDLDEVSKKIDSNFITILSPLYPSYLKNTHKPPFVIFYKGDITLLSKYHKTIALVGGIETNEYGIKNIDFLMNDLNSENVIFSTIENEGINNEVFDNALKNEFNLINVIQEPMKDYLKKTIDLPERNNLLVITEVYESDNNMGNMVQEYSNRMLCGISKGIVFIHFKANDLVNKLFSFAVNEGKEIFAIPDETFSKNSTNKLIKNGAKLVENAKDILNEI
ncbi:DNA-processing protein DprA [Spiroplasma sp. BIUS-1]|uniref:DNA-processing protein DprA n=1 Tax=Spiroplasma sp. BIUS-1 TaxID=216964 RepID=UPI001396F1EB|nr:DNA-processing protein DprA [Spiroplasma sp. BIUS-1]QHX36514.1 DNA processing/uptake protein [Spiroplasma sp. BIUS-1]